MKATVLTDNIEGNGLKGEWGLCIYIEYEGKNILLDAGSTKLFSLNAQKLGISLEQADYAVLSHAHYDHSDGMSEFFALNSRAKLYLRDTCKENCYFKLWLIKKYIGMEKGFIEKYKDRIKPVSGIADIDKGISLVPHSTAGLESIGKKERMYRKEGSAWKADDFSHEQSLVFDTPDGLVIFNSCSHGGADNIIREVSQAYPDKQLYALIGGFHLYNKSDETVINLAKRIKATGIKHIYTGHCTGDKAYGILKQELGDIVSQLKVGLVIDF